MSPKMWNNHNLWNRHKMWNKGKTINPDFHNYNLTKRVTEHSNNNNNLRELPATSVILEMRA